LELPDAALGRPAARASYEAARVRDYLFHDFGDTHLILR
jgi:hypothetical protein